MIENVVAPATNLGAVPGTLRMAFPEDMYPKAGEQVPRWWPLLLAAFKDPTISLTQASYMQAREKVHRMRCGGSFGDEE